VTTICTSLLSIAVKVASGTSTSTPCWIVGATTIKMMSITSITSTKGVMFISAITDLSFPNPTGNLLSLFCFYGRAAQSNLRNLYCKKFHIRSKSLILCFLRESKDACQLCLEIQMKNFPSPSLIS
jgi:hypothetical protein